MDPEKHPEGKYLDSLEECGGFMMFLGLYGLFLLKESEKLQNHRLSYRMKRLSESIFAAQTYIGLHNGFSIPQHVPGASVIDTDASKNAVGDILSRVQEDG